LASANLGVNSAKGLATFLVISFVLAWLIELWPVRRLGLQNPLSTLFLVAVMWTPSAAAFSTCE
jgi:hypothetical protein